MQLILDNLGATLIAGTLFLMLVVVHHGNQKTQIAAASFHMMRAHQVQFVNTLRRDMSGFTKMCAHNEQACVWQGDEDSDFTFLTRLRDDTTQVQVTYRAEKVGERDNNDLYQVERYVSSASGGVAQMDGASMSTLVKWSIVAQNEDGQPIRDSPEASQIREAKNARQIEVRFETLTPIATGEELIRRPWETRYRPESLRARTTL